MRMRHGTMPVYFDTGVPLMVNLPDGAYVFGLQTDVNGSVLLAYTNLIENEGRAWQMQTFRIFPVGAEFDDEEWSPLQVPMFSRDNVMFFACRAVRQ